VKASCPASSASKALTAPGVLATLVAPRTARAARQAVVAPRRAAALPAERLPEA